MLTGTRHYALCRAEAKNLENVNAVHLLRNRLSQLELNWPHDLSIIVNVFPLFDLMT